MTLWRSKLGEQWSGSCGILELMDDLGRALTDSQLKGKISMLGGGNPPLIPGVSEILRQELKALLDEPSKLDSLLGTYDPPQGRLSFLKAVAEFFQKHYDWPIDEGNIAVLNGSQNSCFLLFNLLAGTNSQGRKRRILFPIIPEYIGYFDQMIEQNVFLGMKPKIEIVDSEKRAFKYRIDFDNLPENEDISLVVLSRPTNPTGNVVDDHELDHLMTWASERKALVLCDNAYGAPFPGLLFTKARLPWNENIIHLMSLSKVGLPALRCGLVIGPPEVIQLLSRANAIVNLATGSFAQGLAENLFRNGKIEELANHVIRPFYQARALAAHSWLLEYLPVEADVWSHRCEGAMFHWLWAQKLKISAEELYHRLKKRGVLIVPGTHFFPGLQDPHWEHPQQCLRLNYSHDPEMVKNGIKILGEELVNRT